MKKTMKRILAIICCIAVVLTGISANNILDSEVQAASASASSGTITITSEGTSIPVTVGSNAGYLNMGYSTDVTNYGLYGDDFLTAAFVEEYVTFGGGMTSTDLMNGKFQFCIATNNILQFNWNQRSTAFTEGWSFTIAQGAPISYRTNASGNPIAYLALAKEYTFTFRSGDSTCDNYVDITGCYVEEFSLGGLTLWGNGLQGTSEIYFGSSLTKTPGAYTYKEMQNDAAYADYIRIANKKFEDLDGDVRIQYIVSDGAQCFQFLDWGSLRTTMKSGDRIIFHKGLPIYYTDTAGAACRAVLDATYVYECVGSNPQNSQTFLGVKLDDTTKYGLNTNATGEATAQQNGGLGNEQYVNLWFDKTISSLSSHSQREMLNDSIVNDYIQVADMTMEQVKALGMAIRFIPNAGNGCLQVAFSDALVDALQVGDTILFKEGMPVVYVYNGVLYAATLDTDYVIIVNANDGTTLNVSYTLADTYSLSGSVNGPGREDKNYYDIPIESEAFADATSGTNGSFGEVWKEYLTLSAHDTSAFTADNARMNWYLIDGYRILRPYTDLTIADGEVLMIKEGLPFTYTATTGKAKTVYLDKDYGFVYSATTGAFTYDPTLKSESEPIEKVTAFGLDTVSYGTWEEVGNQVFNNSITGNPFNFETVYRNTLDETAETVGYLDYSACTDADKVKNNTNIIFILADANTQVIQVQFAPEAVAALEVGDKIVLRKGMPVAYSETDAEAIATLDDDYAFVITGKNGDSVTIRTELIGSFSLPGVFYHAPEGINYTDVPYASSSDLADAMPMDSVRLDAAIMRDYLEISGETYESLLAKGYYMQVFTIDALRGLRINYSQLEFQPGDVILFKEGLPLTYTTTSGKTKTVYLDDTYGYRKNEQTAFVYDETLKEIVPPEIIEFGFGDNEGVYTNAHDDYMGFNLPLSGGALETTVYLYPDFLADTTNYSYIEVEGYSTQELRSQGFEVLFIPSAGVMQIIGTLEWEEGMKISLKKGMTVSYIDGNAKQAVLDGDYSYQIVKENGVFVLKKADYFVNVTVDGTQCVAEKYKFGTKLDLSQYKNEEKGKVMAIKVNGESTDEMTVVVDKNLQIEIENRSDICIVVFRDNGKTCAVSEYKLTDKDIKIPYAPDMYGYDDSWEAFELVNGIVYVDAVHTEKQLHPIVKLSGVVVEDTDIDTDTNQSTSPETGDLTTIGTWFICGAIAMMLVTLVLVDKKKKASER